MNSRGSQGLNNIEEVDLPSKLKYLDGRVLKDTKIKEITLPESLETIGSGGLGIKTLCINLHKLSLLLVELKI